MVSVFQYSPAIWPQVAAATISVLLAAYAWPRRSIPGARPYFFFLIAFITSSLADILLMMAVELPLKLAFRQVWSICVLLGAWFTLAFTLDYTRYARTLPAWAQTAIALPLVIAAGLVITAQKHTLVWTRAWLDGGALHVMRGPIALFYWAYTYVLLAAAMVLLLRALLRARGPFRWQTAFLIGGLTLTGLGEAAELVLGNNLTPAVDISTIGFTVGLLVYAIALFRFRTFDLAPIARDRLVERLADGMLALDAQERVVDLNPAARQLLAGDAAEPIGQAIADVLRTWPDLLAVLQDPDRTQATISHEDHETVHTYLVSVVPLSDPADRPLGRLITWHDVTLLQQQQEEMAQQRLALATLTERDRLGKELHDGLGQTLGFIRLEAQAGRDVLDRDLDRPADHYLAKIASVAQEAQDEVREFLLGVRGGGSSPGQGFFAGLQDYLARYQSVHPIQVELDRPVHLTDESIEPVVQAQLLRIIQESLANVRQHAGATRVHITFAHEGDTIRVTIEDNGHGFAPATLHDRRGGHYGLRFMRERAEGVGGALQLEAAPGRGVKVIAQVPARQGSQFWRVSDENPVG